MTQIFPMQPLRLLTLLVAGAVGMHQSQVQSQEEELQELRHCDSESVQGTYAALSTKG